ncbi:hypothetical protein Tcan_01156, partial [Toxocara canis]
MTAFVVIDNTTTATSFEEGPRNSVTLRQRTECECKKMKIPPIYMSNVYVPILLNHSIILNPVHQSSKDHPRRFQYCSAHSSLLLNSLQQKWNKITDECAFKRRYSLR